ncbi:hypothetical protein C7H19_05190 [Aphanothece hegewaldii CCALA 016]|uniref:PEP-CTERM sorting domain-containing protein n=1 Tax=Aphanothece hegewaldii CCALA 016 TaxID=2107694 RepID=A0A2T1M134_9CHRO|nr:hypothetical protein [Aphanothece hegewaldii]PSF38385.1 hypothetical protein C7H19_05190 [Aphanothece hegewaldii CCALA 016]
MKTLNVQAALTGASLALGLGFLTPDVAQAASFNFSYMFADGETFSGMVDGDINPNDPDEVINLSNLMGSYSGDTSVIFNTLAPGLLRLPLDGVGSINISGSDGDDSFFGITYDASNGVGGAVTAAVSTSTVQSVDTAVTFDRDRFEAAPKAVPESQTAVPLIFLGLAFLGNEVRKNRSSYVKK